MRVGGPDEANSLSFDNMQNRPIKGTIDWKKYEIILDVPENSVRIAFGILLNGQGKAWIGDLKFDIVNDDIPSTDLRKNTTYDPDRPLNLDFEVNQ